MTEQQIRDYNKWLTTVWSPFDAYIPFMEDAPKAYLDYLSKKINN